MVMTERVIHEVDYGHDSVGQVRLINGEYRCFVTPLFGGDWIDEGKFATEDEAIEYIESYY
jgi:hypothetical protein